MNAFNWSCPHCERAVTITKDRLSVEHHVLNIKGADGNRLLATSFFVCPNPDCTKFTLAASLHETVWNNDWRVGKELERWALVPDSRAKNFPEYIPQQILEDYREACTIKSLSPKASATLSRRCLQGMIRDFWSVKPGRLVDEIGAIEEKVDPLTWTAIQAVRKIGNIGAHMEKDIGLIVEVDPNEADLLLELIETLLREWYVQRHERKLRMEHLVAAAASKKLPPTA